MSDRNECSRHSWSSTNHFKICPSCIEEDKTIAMVRAKQTDKQMTTDAKPRVWKHVKSINHEWSTGGSSRTTFQPNDLKSVIETRHYDAIAAKFWEVNENLKTAVEALEKIREYQFADFTSHSIAKASLSKIAEGAE